METPISSRNEENPGRLHKPTAAEGQNVFVHRGVYMQILLAFTSLSWSIFGHRAATKVPGSIPYSCRGTSPWLEKGALPPLEASAVSFVAVLACQRPAGCGRCLILDEGRL